MKALLRRQFAELIEKTPGLEERLEKLDLNRLPRHVAVIMDGNGRWAFSRNLERVEGHRAGTRPVGEVVEYSARLGIDTLTLYAFSAENWKRPADEVNTLWALLREYLRRELPTLQRHQIRFRAVGRLQELAPEVFEELENARRDTADNSGLQLVVALNYSGRLELVDAFRRLSASDPPEPITEESIGRHLYTAGLPDLDLLIRTSGEMRLSNFLLWQVAYAEIYVSDVLWPDFTGLLYLDAVLDYQNRERRYGGLQSTSFQSTS